MLLCTPADLSDLLLQEYIDACETKNPGLTARTIAAVSGEVKDALSYRYPQPWPYVPDMVRYIASVIAAYRVVESLTSLVDTESSAENPWLPLQKQWKHCTELLEDLATGKLRLPLQEAIPDREEASVAVISETPLFDFRGF